MGNLCGQERLEQTSLMKSKLCLSKVIGKAFVQILQGDILKEQTSAILNVAHDPYSSHFIKIFQSSLNIRPQLITGVPTLSSFQHNGIQFIIHLKIPNDFEILDQEDQIQAFINTFELASSKNLESISFTEPPKDITQIKQKDLYAKLLLSAFQFYIFNSSNPKINLLKIINQDQSTTNIYIKELLQIAVISTKQSFDIEPISNCKEQNNNQQLIIQSASISVEQKSNIQSYQLEIQQNNYFRIKQEIKTINCEAIFIQQDRLIQDNLSIQQDNIQIAQQNQQNQSNQESQEINDLEFEKQFVFDYSKFIVCAILEQAILNFTSLNDS
ncbi:unnamed protein product [Paramecium sonneborni]|uniref:Uncharacterized protein n=1 Tax=Paramecium sonneborni TaxID=65129 RepID=A0A8S1Q556_9CILI|nr:unnamed protein product [Paramecium sonneborni]